MSFSPFSTASLVRHDRQDREERTIQPSIQPQRDVSGLTARLAIDPQTRNDAFTVRHESYLAAGYLDAKPDGLFSDEYDDMPNSHTVVVYKHNRPVASVRFTILDTDPTVEGWDDMPASHLFPDEVQVLTDKVNAAYAQAALAGEPRKYARALEINRLVRHPDFKDDSELVFVLFRFATYMVLYHDVDITLSCVRRNHMPFYQRVIKLKNVAGPRHYPGLKFATNLLACDKDQYATVVRDAPIFNSARVLDGSYDSLFDGETVNVFGDE